jgi:hypothetical protein
MRASSVATRVRGYGLTIDTSLHHDPLAAHFSGVLLVQCIGTVVVTNVNGPSSEVMRACHGARISYSLLNEICADLICSTASRPEIPLLALRRGHVYAPAVIPPDPAGASDPGIPLAATPTLSSCGGAPSGLPMTVARITQMILRFLIEKNALLFSTVKGISNAAPKDGGPGEKIGGVGQGGPAISYMALVSPATATRKPNATLAANHRRRCIRSGGMASVSRCWFIFSLGVALPIGCDGFFTEVAPVFCGVSTRYCRAEGIEVAFPTRERARTAIAETSS